MKSTAEAIPAQKDGMPTEGPFFFEPIPSDWHMDPDSGFRKDSLFMVVDSRAAGEVLAVVEKVAAGFEQSQANARLFAASWSMLAALKLADRVMDELDVEHEPEDDEARIALESVRAAIKLAEGR